MRRAEPTVKQSDSDEPHDLGNSDERLLNSTRTPITSFSDRTDGLSVASSLLLPLITSVNRRFRLEDPNKQAYSLKTFSFQE